MRRTRILQPEAYRVEAASDGAAGLVAANKVQPILIITDGSMSGMNGIEFCRQLRHEPKLAEIAVVLASADDQSPFGATVWDEFWLKPVSIETMFASIRRLVGTAASLLSPRANPDKRSRGTLTFRTRCARLQTTAC
ncbi:response regulator [Paraburkholderia sp. RL16-012-BIC-B]|uniref:response regulator n=1 Tax=Paraburkholderia madseniana TaxID=2599607 RepID=UPI0015C553AC|nr:response regulator [Paraburkholderia madseniana]